MREEDTAAAWPPPVVDDPVEAPRDAGIGIVVEPVAQFPASLPTPMTNDRRMAGRRARINYLGEVPDGSGRLYVPDLNGRLYLMRGGDEGGRVRVMPYLDLKAHAGKRFRSEMGLGTGFGFVTFHPEFARNGKFYTVHAEYIDSVAPKAPTFAALRDAFVAGIITEWTARDPRADVFAGTSREVMRLHYSAWHGLQQIDFNPTATPGDADYGLLYIALGDGFQGHNTEIPQALTMPYGKLLRIDPAGTNGPGGTYGIPASNPFVGRPGALGEIYAIGLRDPHRFSWDRGGSHRLLLAHIGEHHIEAVYDVRAGDNFGWSHREGPYVFDREARCQLRALPPNDADSGYTYPVAAYDHDPPPDWVCGKDVGRAISGGFVYRGARLPALQGKYVFGDLVDGRVLMADEAQMVRGQPMARVEQLRVFDAAGRETTMAALVGDARVDLRFGTDAAGELYLVTKADGRVWRVTGVRAPATR